MSDLVQRAQDLVDAARSADRRQRDRRKVGEKTPCPECGWMLSDVLPRTMKQGRPIYRRARRCRQCECEYFTTEQFESIIKSGQKKSA